VVKAPPKSKIDPSIFDSLIEGHGMVAKKLKRSAPKPTKKEQTLLDAVMVEVFG